MNTTWLTVRAWTLGLRGVLAEPGAARLRWCVVCGRVGLRRWQPLCAAMPITWVCADWASCRHRQVLVLGGRPGPTPALGPDRPWRPGRTASPSCVLHGPQLLISGLPAHGAMAAPELAARSKEQAGDPAAELPVLVRLRPNAASSGRGGDGR
jgi:hypothetical protein